MPEANYHKKDGYETSRVMYIIEALFEYFISLLVSGAYLAKLTTTVGLSDSTTAILSSITSLSGIFQIFSIYLAHKTPVKRWIIPMQITAQSMFAALYLIPIFGAGKYTGTLFFIVIITAYGIKSICSPPKVNWFMSLVEPSVRGSYSSILTITSVVGGTTFTFLMSKLIDKYEASGSTDKMFTTITIVIFILIILNNLPLIIAKEKPAVIEKGTSPLRSISNLMKNKKYKHTLLTLILYHVANGLCIPFLGTYQINELGFSMTFIASVDVVINIIWITGLATAGRLSRKVPYRSILGFAFITTIPLFGTLIFTAPGNGAILFPIYKFFSTVYSSAQAVSQSNYIFDITESDQRVSALALYTICTGVSAFLTTLAITPLVDYVQANPITLFGMNIYAQQILAIASFAVAIILNIIWHIAGKNEECQSSAKAR